MIQLSVPAGHRFLRAVVVAAMAATTLAFVPLPTPIDEAMVERAVTGAEWLAARAAEAPGPVENAEDAIDLTNWLLAASDAGGVNYEAFATYLAMIGYGASRYAVQEWADEFTRVLDAEEAARRAGELRSVEELEAEINALPSLPLDKDGELERDRLLDELYLALTPEEERRAVAPAADRLAALRMLSPAEAEQ